MTTTFNDYELFGREADEHQACCDNCEGALHTRPPGPIYAVTINGTNYATDTYLAVRADLVTPARRPRIKSHSVFAWHVPDEQPPPSTANLNPKHIRTLFECGFDICEGAGPLEPQHLYLDGEHVGWLMPMRQQAWCTLADAPELRRIARNLPVVENEDPWVTAFRLLKWERSRASAREGGE